MQKIASALPPKRAPPSKAKTEAASDAGKTGGGTKKDGAAGSAKDVEKDKEKESSTRGKGGRRNKDGKINGASVSEVSLSFTDRFFLFGPSFFVLLVLILIFFLWICY